MMVEVVFATANPHKLRELRGLLRVAGIHWCSLAEFPRVAVRERGGTFEANAVAKARAVARAAGRLAIADDSGLEVDELGGAPGVRSARFAGRHGRDEANNAKVLRLLSGVPPPARTARYRCVLALADPGRVLAVAEGVWRGAIAEEPAGAGGFGYDPIFRPSGSGKTVAQLPASVKRRLSHRARAARQLRPTLARLIRAWERRAPRRRMRRCIEAPSPARRGGAFRAASAPRPAGRRGNRPGRAPAPQRSPAS